ncbi:MAG: hypothetical protein ACREPQ_00405 [Rhodanobacter sp.]
MFHPQSKSKSKPGGRRRLATLLLVCGTLLTLTTLVDAQSIGDLATNVASSTNKVGVALQVGGRLVGLGLVFAGLFTHYKAHKEQGQGRASHSIAIVSWIVGAAFFYAASVVHTSGNTLWGNGGGDQSTIQIQQN